MDHEKNSRQEVKFEYLTLTEENPTFKSEVGTWVDKDLGGLTKLQKTTIPRIRNGESTLIIAPTGSGKTFAGFVGIIDELLARAKRGMLEERVYAIYISPLRALNNDIAKNLEQPLKQIGKYIGRIPIRIAVRTGDTTSSTKAMMLKRPPHILITTPESLGISLATKKFSTLLKDVEWVIVDEIHDVASNKRGTFLSLCLEWLEWNTKSPPVRIGMSATVHPVERIGNFLMGRHKGTRKLNIAVADTKKKFEIGIIIPTRNIDIDRFEKINQRLIEHILQRVDRIKTMIIFANTRKWTEFLAAELIKASEGKLEGKVGVHHGSIDRELRLSTEQKMKAGELKIIVTSTSLELGIDIGEIDLALQWGSPKKVSTAIQRLGRAGHSLGEMSKGEFLASDMTELLEGIVIKELALNGKIEEVQIPPEPLDVLSQVLVGLVGERSWGFGEVLDLIRSSYPYRNLRRELFQELLESMSNPTSEEEKWRYGRIWWNREEQRLGKKGNARLNFIMNAGTIPDVATIQVIHEVTRSKIGTVSERFAERLTPKDVFILGGAAYRYLRTVGNKIIVRKTHGMRPTIPSWAGEGISRSFLVGNTLGALLETLRAVEKTNGKSIDNLPYEGKEQILDFIERQKGITDVPTHRRIVVEIYQDASGITNVIVLSIFGRKVNEPIAHAIATAISREFSLNVGISVTDNGFALVLPPGFRFSKNPFDLVGSPDEIETLVRTSITKTEQFKLRFRHVAVRSLMILKRSTKFKRSPEQQFQAAQRLLKYLEPDFPLLRETEKEIFTEIFDMENAKRVIRAIKSNKIDCVFFPNVKVPSPMTHEILLSSNVDVILMENRRELLLSLHKQVVSRMLGEQNAVFDKEMVGEYFSSKLKSVEFTKERICEFILLRAGRGVPIEEMNRHFRGFDGPIIGWIYKNRIFELFQLLAFLVIGGIKEAEVYNFENGRKEKQNISINEFARNLGTEEAAEYLIYHLLFTRGPLSKQEICHYLAFAENIVQGAVERLLQRGEIVGGNIIDQQLRYLTRKDYDRLSLKFSRKNINDESIFRKRYLRLLHGIEQGNEDIVSVLEFSGPIRHFLSLFQRMSKFTWGSLLNGLEHKELYFGRFLGGGLVLVTSHHARLMAKIIGRNEQLSDDERIVFQLIGERPGISFMQIVETTGFNRQKVRETIRLLENLLYVGRVGEGVISKFTQNQQFIALPDPNEVEKTKKEALEEILREIIRWYNAVTIDDLLTLLKIPYVDVEQAIEYLVEKGEISSLLVGGITYYLDVSEDFKTTNSEKVLLVPWEDPIFLLRGKFHQEWIHPRYGSFAILYDGDIVGSVEFIHQKRDLLQILNISMKRVLLYERRFLEPMIKEIIKVGKEFFRSIVITIEEINGQSLNQQELNVVTSLFQRYGFQLDRDYLISERLIGVPLRIEDVIELKLIGITGRRKRPDNVATFLKTFEWFTEKQFANHYQSGDYHRILEDWIKKGKVSVKKGIYRYEKFMGKDTKDNIRSLLRHNLLLTLIELEELSKIPNHLLLSNLADMVMQGEVKYILDENRTPYYFHNLDLEVVKMKNRSELFLEWWLITDISRILMGIVKIVIPPLSGANLLVLNYGRPIALARTKGKSDTFFIENIHFPHDIGKNEMTEVFRLIENHGFGLGYNRIGIKKINDFSPNYWIGGEIQ
ncbi:MAG: DEAD/DEAH box helicase [Methanobacteriota archaeon]|nr:MAG: DEAD/DEAH box helicase [Euryarchaeota archaeon]